MLTSAITVLERRNLFTGPCHTVPYEVGWASEAIFFVQAAGSHPLLSCTPEISPDGFAWLSCGPAVVLHPSEEIAAVAVSRFGTWLRLRVEGPTDDDPTTLLIHLALKG